MTPQHPLPAGTSVRSRRRMPRGAGLVLKTEAEHTYVRWDSGQGMCLSWELLSDLEPIHASGFRPATAARELHDLDHQEALDSAGEPELERLRRLPTTEPLHQGPSKADIAAACEQLTRELSSPEFAAAVHATGELATELAEQLCPNCDARMSGKRCYSCGLEQL